MKILMLTSLFLAICSLAFADAGYKRTPWGSNTWEGPGRPPHWSPVPSDSSSGDSSAKKKHFKRNDRYGPNYRRHNNHKNKKYIIVSEEKIPQYRYEREQVRVKTRYVPVYKKSSQTAICSGDTVYLKNTITGEITINYVSSAGACR